MAKSTLQESNLSPHNIRISERKQMEITGVVKVCAFDESQVCLKTSCGNLKISGKSLHVLSLLPDENKAMIEGSIDAIIYSNTKSHGALGRLFR